MFIRIKISIPFHV